jgi:hypothetical protein
MVESLMAMSRSILLCVPLIAAFATVTLADCTLTNTMHTPLNDLGAGTYQGFAGGLYPNGANTRPPTHEAAGLALAASLSTNNGTNVLLSIGMSNTTQEFATKGPGAFKPRADADPAKNSRLIIVDGAQGGQDATKWTNINAATWTTVDQRLAAAHVTSNNVRIVWLKQALAGPRNYGAFPNHARALQSMLEIIVRNAKARYPNLKLLYVSSRTRAYTDDASTLNPEPFAYEAGWATKWMIEDQLRATNSLNYDPKLGPVVAPWLSWGPYIWTDGTTPRSDGYVYLCRDLESDFTHPNTNGVTKVADQLLAFFKTDPTAAPWFLKPSSTLPSLNASANPTVGIAPLTVNFNATGSAARFYWTFDDGDFSLRQNPTKAFVAPGRYDVRLTAQDTAGNAALTTLVVNVSGPFAICAVNLESNNVRVAWTATGGLSYVVESSSDLANYSGLSPVIAVPDSGETETNYIDAGGATNSPSLFYRVKLVP